MSAPAGLGRSASRGAVVTVAAQAVRLLVQLAGIVVLARLLAPEDYGLVAVVGVVVTFGELVRDLGLGPAAVQARVLTRGQRDNLFWLNTALGAGLAALLCAAAPLLAAAFGDPRITGIAAALSGVFLVNGLATQYRSMHLRSLRFGTLAGCEIGGQVAGVALGIALAAGGAGPWSLVGQQLGQVLVTQVLLVATGGWLPGWVDRTAPVRPFLGFGLPLLGAQVLNSLASNTDTLVIGARFGPAPLGVYNRAFQLVMMPLLQVQAPSTRVALPVLARLRDDRARFAEFLLLGQVALLTIVGTAFAVLFAQAPAAVAVALGPGWTEAVPLFRILLVAGFCQAATYAVNWVFLASGRTRSQLRYALATRPALAAVVVAGSAWGVQGVAVAYAAGLALCWPVALLWIRRATDAPVGAMLGNGLRVGALAVAVGAGAWAAGLPVAAGPAGVQLLAGAVGGVAALTAVGLLWPAVRRDLRAVAGLRRHLRRARTPAVPAGPAAGPAAVPARPLEPRLEVTP